MIPLLKINIKAMQPETKGQYATHKWWSSPHGSIVYGTIQPSRSH